MGFFAEDLIISAKNRTLAPVSQNTYSESDILLMASEEMLSVLVPDIMSVREDFFLSESTTALVAGLNHYQVPKRAIGNSLKALFFIDSAGQRKPLVRVDVERSGEYSGTSGDPEKFYFAGDEVIILPTPAAANGSLIFSHFFRPNDLIATSSCAKITAVSTLAGITTFTVDTDLTGSLNVGDSVDFLNAKSPFLLWADTVAITNITSTTIEFSATDVQNEVGSVEPQVGDYICPNGYANIPMLPAEFHAVLYQQTAIRLLMGLGHLDKLNFAMVAAKAMREDAKTLIRNRVEISPEKITGRNPLTRAFS